MKIFTFLVLVIISISSFAGGWTQTGKIEFIEVVRGQGFLVKGALGSKIGCTDAKDGYLWVAIDHPQYDTLYSTVLAAYMSGKSIKAYTHDCTEIGWYSGKYSTLSGSGSLNIKD